jgi:apolipoprotein N-acyltransferase
VRPRLADGLLAAAAGALLAAAFAEPGWSVLAWFALLPLLRAIDGESLGRAFRLGWVAGMMFFCLSLGWIPATIARAGDARLLVTWLPLAGIAAALALYPALFAAGLRYWQTRVEGDGLAIAVALWVGLEWCRATLLLPCPWNLLGYSQAPSLRLLQLCDVTGIYGVSALVVGVNHVLYGVLARRVRPVRLALVGALWLLAVLYGDRRIAEIRDQQPQRTARIALVQPAIEPHRKWDSSTREETLTLQENLSRAASAQGVDLIVWPEAAAPFVFAEDEVYATDAPRFAADRQLRERTITFVRGLGTPLLFGAPALAKRTVGRGLVWSPLNRSLLLAPSGRLEANYDKMILVPFGEYVPLSRILWFVPKLVPGVGDFVPGAGPTLFALGDARFAVLICYEAIFPDFVRGLVGRGADFLVNQTNDGWFGNSRAPFQHLTMAAVRAIENRVPMVRVANTGISAVVRPDGAIESAIPLGTRGVRIVEIGTDRRVSTFYTRHGDWFARAAILAAALMLLYASWTTRETQPAAVEVA